MRYRLRYQHHDLELMAGQFAVGRSASCQLALDDPLVSRRHALLVVDEEAVTLEDLKSRNGVLVNGSPIEGRVVLAPGDRISIGAQELTLLLGRAATGTAEAQQTLNSTMGKMTVLQEESLREDTVAVSPPPLPRTLARPPSRVGARAAPGAAQTPLPIASGRGAMPADEEPSVVRRPDAFKLLAGVADKAMAMGRAQEAERLLAAPLNDTLDACRARRQVPPATVDQAAKLAARLATTTAKGVWADYVVELYALQQRPPPAPVIDELYTAFRKVNGVDVSRLRGFVEQLRERLPSYGPAERFLLQRLEGLERLATLR